MLVKGDVVICTCDASDEAYQEGVGRFGFGPFLAQLIDPRDVNRLAPYFGAGIRGASA